MRKLWTLLGGLAAVLGLLLAWVFHQEYQPEPLEPVVTHCEAAEEPLELGQDFKVLSWNLQFSAGRSQQFFYDGGEAVHVDPDELDKTLLEIQRILGQVNASVNLLQEIDRDSARTGRVDQLPSLAQAAGAGCVSSASYHRAAFVPKPLTQPLGRVDLALGILTRATHRDSIRHQLALMDEPRVVQALNLKRALLTAELPVKGSVHPLKLGVTHLSAFSFGDGTLAKQVAALEAWMAEIPPDQPWILAGDFNLLPPGDDPGRLSSERELYQETENPMERLLPRFQEAWSEHLLALESRTYLPFGADRADRKIDYLFYGGPLDLMESEVLKQHSTVSDHLPLVARFRLRAPGGLEEGSP